MKSFLQLFFLSILATCFISCKHACSFEDKVKTAVNTQLSIYPESRLQDLYKAFFQAEFGPEHIISDTLSAGQYLDRELAIYDASPVFAEPVGTDSSFFRVHLSSVQQGLITRNQLFDAFISGAHKVEAEEVALWRQKWTVIEEVISDMNLGLPDFDADSIAIDSLLNEGGYAVHHSRHFSETYDPHYRIVRKDIYLLTLSDKLK